MVPQNQDHQNKEKIGPRLILIAGIMLVAMTVYEVLKQVISPNITIWQSHIVTIIFSTLIATVVGYFVLRKVYKLNDELNQKIAQVSTLSGLLPICASCKKIRDDKGYWNQIESYIKEHSEADFSHSICPECSKKLYAEFDLNRRKKAI